MLWVTQDYRSHILSFSKSFLPALRRKNINFHCVLFFCPCALLFSQDDGDEVLAPKGLLSRTLPRVRDPAFGIGNPFGSGLVAVPW